MLASCNIREERNHANHATSAVCRPRTPEEGCHIQAGTPEVNGATDLLRRFPDTINTPAEPALTNYNLQPLLSVSCKEIDVVLACLSKIRRSHFKQLI